jgi:protein-tyrosine phosphatase
VDDAREESVLGAVPVAEVRRILFVCSGNICRSPMAALLARRQLERAGVPAVVISGGTLGIQGTPAASFAVQALQEVGLDLSDHRSQGVPLALARVADSIVVMSPEHAEALLERDPSLGPRIVRLWEYADPPGSLEEIADPVGLDLAAFVECRQRMEQCLARWLATPIKAG